MNINHSAEFIALWKSHKRAEWEAVRLDLEAKAARIPSAAVDAGFPEQSKSSESNAVGVMARVSVDSGQDAGITAEQLDQESRRMWGLYAEIKAELDRVEASLTPAQRKSAEKMLKHWEQEERAQE